MPHCRFQHEIRMDQEDEEKGASRKGGNEKQIATETVVPSELETETGKCRSSSC